jgi:hypothetical protein
LVIALCVEENPTTTTTMEKPEETRHVRREGGPSSLTKFI